MTCKKGKRDQTKIIKLNATSLWKIVPQKVDLRIAIQISNPIPRNLSKGIKMYVHTKKCT